MSRLWIFRHTSEWSRETADPRHLLRLRNAEYIKSEFRHAGLVVYEWRNWFVVRKKASASYRDIMVIYTWDDINVSSIAQLWENELWELDTILSIIISKTREVYKEEFENNEADFSIGINSLFYPGAWRPQSVFRPHFHCTILPRQPQTKNNVIVQELTKEQIELSLSLNEQNKKHVDALRAFLETSSITYHESHFDWQRGFALEFDLDMQHLVSNLSHLSKTIRNDFLENTFFHESFEKFLTDKTPSLSDIQNLWQWSVDKTHEKLREFEWNWEKLDVLFQLGFSIGINFADNYPRAIITFWQRTPGGGIGNMEALGHHICRKRVENPTAPLTEIFGQQIWEVLKGKSSN